MDRDVTAEQDLKRRKTGDGALEHRIPLIANELIDLVFTNSTSEQPKPLHPEYTHQIFENEIIDVSPASALGKVEVTVDCRDLSHCVKFVNFAAQDVQCIDDKLQKALPDSTVLEKNRENTPCTVEANSAVKLQQPPGTLLHTFTRPNNNNENNNTPSTITYEVWLATAKDAGASELLHRAEKIALWYIETADSVDFSDDRWEAIFLFSAHTAAASSPIHSTNDGVHSELDSTCVVANMVPVRSFVGYMTLFSFRNPFLGTKLRVCQALILPHMQATGLGREVLLCVYTQLVMGRDEVCELTVEDPAPGFQRMRDSVDFERFFAHYSVLQPELFEPSLAIATTSETTETIAATNVLTYVAVAKALKIIKSQAQFLVETVEYLHIVREIIAQSVDQVAGNGTTVSADAVLDALESHEHFKAFRLRVKRRILKNDKDLSVMTPKAEMQRALTEEFETELKRFQAIESTAVRLGVLTHRLACVSCCCL